VTIDQRFLRQFVAGWQVGTMPGMITASKRVYAYVLSMDRRAARNG
jgi:hypothetical protein